MDRAALSPLLRSFELNLRAENRSDNTVESYLESVRQAEAFLTVHGRTLLDARRSDLEAFITELLARRAPATAASRYKALRILYRWLEEEGEIAGFEGRHGRMLNCSDGAVGSAGASGGPIPHAGVTEPVDVLADAGHHQCS